MLAIGAGGDSVVAVFAPRWFPTVQVANHLRSRVPNRPFPRVDGLKPNSHDKRCPLSSPAHPGPITADSPIRFRDALPDGVDIAIVGGGIIGICSALFCARAGLRVAVFEKGRIGGEQSSRNWGWVRQQGRDLAELPIMMESTRLWEMLDSATKGGTGFRRAGLCYLASDEAELAQQEEWLEGASQYQLDTRLLSQAEVAAHLGGATGPAGKPWIGGIVTPSDARAEPWAAVTALAELAHSEGVFIRENCAVRAFCATNYIVDGVETEDGNLSAPQVVVAGGAWSGLFARAHKLSLPVLSVRSTAVATEPLPELFAGNCCDETLAIRRREDGGYTLALRETNDHFIGRDSFRHLFAFAPQWKEVMGPTKLWLRSPVQHPGQWSPAKAASAFETVRVLDPPPNGETVVGILNALEERFPQLGRATIKTAWGGMIDTTPDILPILDRAPGIPGLIFATGMSGHGFGIAPAFGKLVAEMASGRQPSHDISKFSLSRF